MVMKTRAEAKENLEAAIAFIPDRYTKGVEKADWITPAKSDQAEKNYADGISKAVAEKTRQKAIARLTNDDWKRAAIDKGAGVIGERIRGALDKYDSNFGPIYEAVQAKVKALPARTVSWRDNITKRLVPTVEAWRKAAGKT